MARQDCVAHYVEGRSAWQLGVVGFFRRFRGFLLSAVVMVATMGSPWWWPNPFPEQITVSTAPVIVVGSGAFGILSIAILAYVRYRSRRSLDIKHHLHELAHFIRDASAAGLPNHGEEIKLSSLCTEISNHTGKYFQRLCNDRNIAVAIRLAVKDKRGVVTYSTVARSTAFRIARKDTSEAVSAQEGLPRYLAEKHNSRGVLIYTDLDAAEKQDTFKKTKNEELYPSDIESMMVAPLNYSAAGPNEMIGLLYVVSATSKKFNVKHVDAMRFAADTVANAIGDAAGGWSLQNAKSRRNSRKT